MNSHIVTRLVVGRVTKVPKWHREYDTFEGFPVHVWLVQHPTTAILVDTGIGLHNELINEWYGPEVVPIDEALAEAGLGVDDIGALVLTPPSLRSLRPGPCSSGSHLRASSRTEGGRGTRLHGARMGDDPAVSAACCRW